MRGHAGVYRTRQPRAMGAHRAGPGLLRIVVGNMLDLSQYMLPALLLVSLLMYGLYLTGWHNIGVTWDLPQAW